MLSRLKIGNNYVGIKQSTRAIRDGRAECAYVAEDADAAVTRPVVQLCVQTGTEVVTVPTMKELGMACGIDVGAAVAVLLKDSE